MKLIQVLLSQTFFLNISLACLGLAVSSCGSGCPYTIQEYTTVANTLSVPVTVTFRHSRSQVEFTETIAVGESRIFELGTFEHIARAKGGVIEALCDDDNISRKPGAVAFSNVTLTQYQVCDVDGVDSTGYAIVGTASIMALTDTCPGIRIVNGY